MGTTPTTSRSRCAEREARASPPRRAPARSGEPARHPGDDATTALRAAGGSGDARPLRIGFWNLKRLGHGEKDLDTVGRVLQQFDVVGIGEVMREEAIPDLVARLGRDAWSAVVSPHAVGRSSYASSTR